MFYDLFTDRNWICIDCASKTKGNPISTFKSRSWTGCQLDKFFLKLHSHFCFLPNNDTLLISIALPKYLMKLQINVCHERKHSVSGLQL